MKRIIGTRTFTDGNRRDVYGDDDGQQFVVGDDGEPVYGNWILIPEVEELTPIVTQGTQRQT